MSFNSHFLSLCLQTLLEDKSMVDYTLLTEEDEWEITYVYLSRYFDILNDVIKVNDIKVGKIVQFLIGLSQSFSRYYNRCNKDDCWSFRVFTRLSINFQRRVLKLMSFLEIY